MSCTILGWSGCVRSDDEQRLSQENAILQQQRNTCGPASLAMLLVEHGVSVTEKELEGQMLPGRDGVSLRTLTETAGRYGVRLEVWRFRRDAVDSLQTPAILWIDGDHFVVLDSSTTNGVFVRDPAKGRLQWSRERLYERWNGTAAVAIRTP